MAQRSFVPLLCFREYTENLLECIFGSCTPIHVHLQSYMHVGYDIGGGLILAVEAEDCDLLFVMKSRVSRVSCDTRDDLQK